MNTFLLLDFWIRIKLMYRRLDMPSSGGIESMLTSAPARPGTVAYARELAAFLDLRDGDAVEIGLTDAALCVVALRQFAKRKRSRFGALCLTALPCLIVGFGMSDFDGNGKSLVADLLRDARAFVGSVPVALVCGNKVGDYSEMLSLRGPAEAVFKAEDGYAEASMER